jgi:hypothetical protein
LARGWAIGGIGDGTREAALAAAEEAGMPVGAWVEQARGKALAKGLEAGGIIQPPPWQAVRRRRPLVDANSSW